MKLLDLYNSRSFKHFLFLILICLVVPKVEATDWAKKIGLEKVRLGLYLIFAVLFKYFDNNFIVNCCIVLIWLLLEIIILKILKKFKFNISENDKICYELLIFGIFIVIFSIMLM